MQIGKSLENLQFFIIKHIDISIVLILIILSTAVFFPNLGNASMWGGDEKLHFQWANHIVESSDYITPWAYDSTYLWVGKPPLIIWLMSFSLRVFEPNFATRFWGAFFGVLSCVFVYYIGKLLFNRKVAMISAIILLTFSSFFSVARTGLLDIPLTFFIVGSIYFFLKSQDSKKSTKFAILSGIFFGFALMTKQLSALLIPLIIFFYLFFTQRNFRFLNKQFFMLVGIGSIIFSPWVILMTFRFGMEFLHINFVYSIFQRATTAVESKTGDVLFYFNYLISNENMFWLILLPFALGLSLIFALVNKKKEHILLTVWIFVVLGIFSISQTKITHYIIPVFPAFALVLGNLLYDIFSRFKLRALIPIIALILILLIEPLSSVEPKIILNAEKHQDFKLDSKITSIDLLPSSGESTNFVTGGYLINGSNTVANLNIWKFTNQEFEHKISNNFGINSTISSIVVGDLDADNESEIVSVGTRDNGNHKVAQLAIWNETLEIKNKTEWFFGEDTTANAVAIGHLDDLKSVKIVTAGTFFNGSHSVALLCVWNPENLILEHSNYWCTFGNTTINSVAIHDIDQDGTSEIIVGGYCLKGYNEISQVSVWDPKLGLKTITGDLHGWTSLWNVNTRIVTLAVGDVDADNISEIVTGGYCYQNNSRIAQITVWRGLDLFPKRSYGWDWYNWTSVNSLKINYSNEDQSSEIITACDYFNGTSVGAQISVWDGSTLSLKAQTPWDHFYESHLNDTVIFKDIQNRQLQIFTGGNYNNGTIQKGQLLNFIVQP